jgi:hypothetical protein
MSTMRIFRNLLAFIRGRKSKSMPCPGLNDCFKGRKEQVRHCWPIDRETPQDIGGEAPAETIPPGYHETGGGV